MGRLGSRVKEGITARAFATLALLPAAGAVGAQGVEDCTAITDRDARLACYDRLHGRSVPAAPTSTTSGPAEQRTAPADTAPPPAEPPESAVSKKEVTAKEATEEAATTKASEAAAAGGPELGAEQLPKSREARQAEKKPDDMVSNVTAMGERNTRKHWFRLENGQLWEQVSIESTNIRQGDAVRVSRGAFGSYTMRRADGSSRSTRVQRRE